MKTSGQGPKNEYVFMESGSPEEFILPFKVYQDYIIANRNNRIPHTRELKIGDTIWFRVREKEVKELGFAKTYRKPFKKSIDELLPKPSVPCSDYDNLCPACRLFGWVNPRETIEAEELHTDRAYAGRVRISPALMDKDVGLIGEIALEILSTPKPTTTYFYLLDQQGKPKFKIEYSTYGAQIQ